MKDLGAFLVDLACRQSLPSNQPRRPAGLSFVRCHEFVRLFQMTIILDLNCFPPVFPRKPWQGVCMLRTAQEKKSIRLYARNLPAGRPAYPPVILPLLYKLSNARDRDAYWSAADVRGEGGVRPQQSCALSLRI